MGGRLADTLKSVRTLPVPLSKSPATRRWFLGRLADNFKSVRALRRFAWGYVPVVGGASAWGCLVFIMIGHFLTSCVEQFAQARRARMLQGLQGCKCPP